MTQAATENELSPSNAGGLSPSPGEGQPPSTAGGLSPRQRTLALTTIVLAVGMSSLDTSIANTALPSIAADLAASPASSIWVVNAYQLALVATLLPFASLCEIYGYRRVYCWGLALFTVASLACAMSWSLPRLTAARVVQGFGASGIMSVNTALIRFIYPPERLGRGLGLNALIVSSFTALGPTVAAGVLAVASWQMMFAINVPVGLLALALALRVIPGTPMAGRAFDAISAVLNAATFGFLIFGIGEGAHRASGRVTAGVFAASVAAGVALVRRQLTLRAPLLPVDLFRRPMFALSSATSMCSFAAQGLAYVALPFYFQTVLGRSAVETGLLLTPWPLMTAIMAPIAGRLSDRFRAATLCGIGLSVLCAGLLLLAGLGDAPSQTAIVGRMVVCGVGFGFFQSPNLRAIMSSAPPERSGGASGIIATSRLVGQSTGAALVALCFALSATHGPALALLLGAGFAGLGCMVSFARLLAR